MELSIYENKNLLKLTIFDLQEFLRVNNVQASSSYLSAYDITSLIKLMQFRQGAG